MLKTELSEMVSWIDMTEEYINGSRKCTFACGEIWCSRFVLFNSFKKTLKYCRRHKKNEMVICDMSLSGDERLSVLICTDEKGNVTYSEKFKINGCIADNTSLNTNSAPTCIST